MCAVVVMVMGKEHHHRTLSTQTDRQLLKQQQYVPYRLPVIERKREEEGPKLTRRQTNKIARARESSATATTTTTTAYDCSSGSLNGQMENLYACPLFCELYLLLLRRSTRRKKSIISAVSRQRAGERMAEHEQQLWWWW